ncbi:MAG: hypothetical protein WC511_01935 [Candidatus Pacearchaeota archaeon]
MFVDPENLKFDFKTMMLEMATAFDPRSRSMDNAHLKKAFVDTHFKKKVLDLQKELKRLTTTPIKVLYEEFAKEREEQYAAVIRHNRETKKTKEKYEKMIQKVKAWRCFNKYTNLKEFALNQLQIGLKWNSLPWEVPAKLTPWKKVCLDVVIRLIGKKQDTVREELSKAIAELKRQEEICAETNTWWALLKENLKESK